MWDETTVGSSAETSDEMLDERNELMRASSCWVLLWAILSLVVQGKTGCDATLSWVVCVNTRVVEVLVDNQELCGVEVDFARVRSGERGGMMGGEE